MRDELPAGAEIEIVDDQSIFIDRAISEVINAAILGGLLAVLVIFVFLRNVWFTLTIALSIPVSIVATFFLMGQAGISLNIMSLGGIALATGLLVDNGIVVLENISRYRAQGQGLRPGRDSRRQRSRWRRDRLDADHDRGVPAAGLRRGRGGSVVSRPGADRRVRTGRLAGGRHDADSDDGLGARRAGAAAGTRQQPVRALVRDPLCDPVETGPAASRPDPGAAAVLFAVAIALLRSTGTELVPQLEQGRFEVELEATPGTPLEETDRLGANVQQVAAGQAGRRLQLRRRRIRQPDRRQSHRERREHCAHAGGNGAGQQRRRAKTPSSTGCAHKTRETVGLETNFTAPELLSFDKPLEIEIQGYDLDSLRAASDEVLRRLRESDRFADIESSVERGHPGSPNLFRPGARGGPRPDGQGDFRPGGGQDPRPRGHPLQLAGPQDRRAGAPVGGGTPVHSGGARIDRQSGKRAARAAVIGGGNRRRRRPIGDSPDRTRNGLR